MQPREILQELVRVAGRLGVEVRFDSFANNATVRGGICRLRGKSTILIDQTYSVIDQIGILAEALSGFDLEPIYLPPLVRARIQLARSGNDPRRTTAILRGPPVIPPMPRPLARASRR